MPARAAIWPGARPPALKVTVGKLLARRPANTLA
jgi:hypothetical protein